MSKDIKTYQFGNTIRFEAQFFDFDGMPVDPEMIRLKIYNSKYVVVHDEPAAKVQGITGKYYYDYETEPKEQRLYYEWYAEIGGKPSLERDEFVTRFL